MRGRFLFVCLALLLAGCSTVTRQRVGRGMANTGQAIGKTGSVITATAGVSLVTLPLVFVAIPVFLVGVPTYYIGCAVAGDKPDTEPFDL